MDKLKYYYENNKIIITFRYLYKLLYIFITKNKIIFSLLIIALHVVLFTPNNIDSSTVNPDHAKLLNLLFQLSIGYIGSFVFYVLQVYVPTFKKYKYLEYLLRNRINDIIEALYEPIRYYNECCGGINNKKEFTNSEIKSLSEKFKKEISSLSSDENCESNKERSKRLLREARKIYISSYQNIQNIIIRIYRDSHECLTCELMDIIINIENDSDYEFLMFINNSQKQSCFPTIFPNVDFIKLNYSYINDLKKVLNKLE